MEDRMSMGPASSRGRVWFWVAVLGAAALVGCGNGSTEGTPGTGGVTGAGGGGGTGTGVGGNSGPGGITGAGGGTGPGGITGATGGITGGGGTTTGGVTGGGGTTGATGGVTGAGGTTTAQARSISSFDDGWLFFKGDATGADQAGFADTSWRPLSVPHDWSIEGPFDANATTLGNGGYLPAGVGWYRKHFTLPANLTGRRIFVEFDGVMAHADIYINGVRLGNRANGYMSFRYEITAQATFGTAANVLAVRADNSAQPASRWYAGAGIYRHVRLIATNPVHVAQWATFVTTPTATTAAATVHVQTSVVNQGTTAQSVTVQAAVSDPAGAALPPVTSAAQNIAAGATVNFAVDVPVTSPRLWSTTAPNMYQLSANVVVGGLTLDNDLVPFGIRTIRFDPDAGFSLNGTNMKFKGGAMHHDISGLGSAVPMRAWQRRLAQMKSMGVNALRTSHNPFAPEVLDLCDRMGILVLDEFFDAWTQTKLAGDFGGTTFNTSGTTDLTDTLKRDRNHPSVVLYSIGNEIRDSLTSIMATATSLVGICHTVDPTRPVTQALFQPLDRGYFPGATGAPASGPTMLSILDVFGANYHITDVITAIAITPHHAGILTEDGSTASIASANWPMVTATPALTGDFIWTAFDYLGEATLPYPNVGSSTGTMDRMGTPKSNYYAWRNIWGTPATAPAAGTTATRIVATADHATMVTDKNDVVYIKAAFSDATGRVVTSATSAVTFSLTGPGTIVAVDSGSVNAETFRGNVRNAFGGLAFAVVQATGPGTITVTATTDGLTAGTATVQATAGAFVPCSGTCD